jgi:hypothetical protein
VTSHGTIDASVSLYDKCASKNLSAYYIRFYSKNKLTCNRAREVSALEYGTIVGRCAGTIPYLAVAKTFHSGETRESAVLMPIVL